MIASDAARAAIVLTIPVAFLAGGLSWPLLGAVAFFLAVAATAFNPARDALLPTLAEGKALLRVNAAFQVSSQLSYIVGAVGVGLLLGFDESAVRGAIESGRVEGSVSRIVRLYWVDAATYGVSLITILLLVRGRRGPPVGRAPPPPPDPPHLAVRRAEGTREAAAHSPFRDVAEGLGFAARSSLLAVVLFVTAADNFFFMGPAVIGVALLVKSTLGLGPAHVAILEAALGAGWLLGTIVLVRWGRTWRKGRILLAGMFLDGLTYVPFYWIRDYRALVAVIAFHGFWIPFIQVPRTTLVRGPGRR